MKIPSTIDLLRTNVPKHSQLIDDPFSGQEVGELSCKGSSLIGKAFEKRGIILKHDIIDEDGVREHWLCFEVLTGKILHTTLGGPSIVDPTMYGKSVDGGVAGELIRLVGSACDPMGPRLTREIEFLGKLMEVGVGYVDPFDMLEEFALGKDFSELRDFSLDTYRSHSKDDMASSDSPRDLMPLGAE